MKDNTELLMVTRRGIEILRGRLHDKLQQYTQVRQERQIAFELSGDGWHDNPEFNRAQQMEANCNNEIKRLTDMLARTQLIEWRPGSRPVRQVEVGSIVRLVRWADTGCLPEERWEIRGHAESDPANGQVAYDAPLGAAIMGLKPGDVIENVRLGEHYIDIEVLALEP